MATVRLGHAYCDEFGGIGGPNTQPGNQKFGQAGSELRFQDWYRSGNGWTSLLRPTTPELADKLVLACVTMVNNPAIGYNQNHRNTLHSQLLSLNYDYSLVTTPCECDCSSFVTACALCAGVTELEYSGNAPTTSNMTNIFANTGKFTKILDSSYINSSANMKKGDILVRAGHHTAMVISDSEHPVPPVPGVKQSNFFGSCRADEYSIVDGLNYVKADSSFAYRTKIAKANGIKNYRGTATQNIKLLELLKKGKLKRP